MLSDDPKTIFMGQAVEYPGTAMYGTLKDVPMEKRLELPVAEDMQLGMAIGMSLNGMLPICIYPRINFLLLAINQLVLHLDRLPMYSKYRPKVIIRTSIATENPLNPGPQHLGDFTDALRRLCFNVQIRQLIYPNMIVDNYRWAVARKQSTILVEMMGNY